VTDGVAGVVLAVSLALALPAVSAGQSTEVATARAARSYP
jgi:hypothetical protein